MPWRRTMVVVLGVLGSPCLVGRVAAQEQIECELRVEGRSGREDALTALKREAIARALTQISFPPSDSAHRQDCLKKRLAILAQNDPAAFVELVNVETGEHEIRGWWASAHARVSATALRDRLETIRKRLDQPQPRVLVLICERVEYTWPWGPPPFREGEIGSMIARQVEAALLGVGYEVLDSTQLEFLRKKRLDFSQLAHDDEKTLLGLARDQGAELLVLGRADVTGPRLSRATPKKPLYMWETKPKVSVCWADTARKVSVPIAERDFEQGGSLFDGPAGARQALDRAGERIGELIVVDLLRRDVGGGTAREITLNVLDANPHEAELIEQCVHGIVGVNNVTLRKTRQGIELRMITTRPAFDLARDIEKSCSKPGQFMLKAEETGATSIDLRVIR